MPPYKKYSVEMFFNFNTIVNIMDFFILFFFKNFSKFPRRLLHFPSLVSANTGGNNAKFPLIINNFQSGFDKLSISSSPSSNKTFWLQPVRASSFEISGFKQAVPSGLSGRASVTSFPFFDESS